MKVNIRKLLLEYNDANPSDKLTQRKLALEMVAAGKYKNEASARNMLQYHSRGDAKSVDYEMLEFLKKKFNKSTNEILTN